MAIEKKEYLAKGKRGLTYRAKYKGKSVVVKERNPASVGLSTLEIEFNFLKELNKHGIGPEVYAFKDGKLVMEYISGELIVDYFRSHSKEEIIEVLRKIFDQLRTMDKLGINKAEMTNPYKHIIIWKEPKMIDFERARKTENPKNITQFCQFLTSKRIEEIFESKDIIINKEKLVQEAKKYKDSYSEESYENLLRAIW